VREIIEGFMPYTRKGQMLIDLSSTMSGASQAFQRSHTDSFQAHIHMLHPPEFGVRGQPTIVSERKCDEKMRTIIRELLSSLDAKVFFQKTEEHDKERGVDQSLIPSLLLQAH
jgi:prephenate dehydrogenase